jgi:hypothetical protein
MEQEQQEKKDCYKDIAKMALKYSGFICLGVLVASLLISLGVTLVLNDDAGFFSFYLWSSGTVLNLMFLNNIGTLVAKVVFLFIITAFIMYFVTRKTIKALDLKSALIYMAVIGLILGLFVGIFTYLTSFIRIEEFSREQAVYRLNPFMVFIRTFLHSMIILLGIKLYLTENDRLNTGLVAFKRYFYSMVLYSFILSVIIEIFLFKEVVEFGLFVKPITLGLIAGVFNVMVYIVLFFYGGIVEFSADIFNNLEIYKLSFIDLLMGDFGMPISTIFLIGFLGLCVILYSVIHRIKEENFIKSTGIFIGSVTFFNGLLVYLTNINVNVLRTRVSLSFMLVPVVVLTLVILFTISLIRYMILLIKRSI